MDGRLLPLAQVNDGVFSHEVLGKGIAIQPSKGVVAAPFDGVVTAMMDSAHAVGLCSKNGLEVLIHIGIDTIRLNGRHFTSHVKKGDEIKKGDLLLEFNTESILSEGFNTTSPVVISNWEEYSAIRFSDKEFIEQGAVLFEAIP